MNRSSEQGTEWVSIEAWFGSRSRDETRVGRSLGLTTPATPDEILALRRRKSGPGVSHHRTDPAIEIRTSAQRV
jgi:hypothetical protein